MTKKTVEELKADVAKLIDPAAHEEPVEYETAKIPAIGLTAMKMAANEAQRMLDQIGTEVLQAMGLSPKDGWQINAELGKAVRPKPKQAATE